MILIEAPKRADGRVHPAGSLRGVLYGYIRRAEAAGGEHIDVLWKEEGLAVATGLQLRRYSGVGSPEDWAHLDPELRSRLDTLVELGLSPWKATCSAFAESKLLREIIRCGLPVVDIDQSIAAWRAVAARHPASVVIADFLVNYEQYLMTAGNADRKVGKSLYSSLITGAGGRFFGDWSRTHHLPIPAPRHAHA